MPDDTALLWDMLDASRAIVGFIEGKDAQDYYRDRMLRGAVERHLEIIGDTARRVSETLKSAHPEIPWRRIIGLRNVLAHEYGEIKHERIWALIVQEISALVRLLTGLVPPSD